MADPEKIDLFKRNKDVYVMPKRPVLLLVKKARYLAVAGGGAPGSEEFQEAIGALYAMAFTIKMTRKFAGLRDYTVCKLEALYGDPETGEGDCSSPTKEGWRWELLIRTPEFVKDKDLEAARAALDKRGKGAGTDRVRLVSLAEGRCVQMLHVGPYDREGESVEVMRAFVEEQGYIFHGRHHDIYLSDPRRVPPERLRTILRRPVRKP